MSVNWIKLSSGINKGVHVINQLEDSRFEQFLNRIIIKIKKNEMEPFTLEEQEKLIKLFRIDDESLKITIKTIQYLFKKMLKFIFVPIVLRNDLKELGFCDEKADMFVKVWSSETKTTLDQLSKENNSQNDLNFAWKLNAELSSDYCKKTKVPKVYLSIMDNVKHNEIELTHSELYSMFIQFEQIQNEVDNL